MAAPSISVEDVGSELDGSPAELECSRDKPEGAQEEPVSSAGSTAEPADAVEEAPGSPAEQPEATAAKAGTKTAKVRCPKCSKELLPKTFNYSHNCDGSRKPRPQSAKLLDADPVLELVEPEPTPATQAKAAPRAKTPPEEEAPDTTPRHRARSDAQLAQAQNADARPPSHSRPAGAGTDAAEPVRQTSTLRWSTGRVAAELI